MTKTNDYGKLALKNLGKRRLRSWLTILGIVIAAAIIFILISLSVGLRNAIDEQFKVLGSDKFFILPKGTLAGPGTSGAIEITTEDAKVVEKVRGVNAVTYAVIGNGKVEFNDETRYYYIAGIPLDKSAEEVYIESSALKIDEGRIISEGDTGKIMIGYDYKYNDVFGKPIHSGDTLRINDKDFKVVGIVARIGNPGDDRNIYMPLEDFKILFNSGDRVDQIVVQILPGEDINDVADRTKDRLIKFRKVTEKTQDFSITTPEELLSSFSVILDIITGFLLGVAAISLIVGSIGIANTMYTSVLERTKEIGTMKAIGAKNSDILLIFLIESGLLGLIGGVIGLTVGYSVSKIIEQIAINQLNTTLLQAASPWWLVLGCLAFAFIIGAGSGVFPAYQASRTKPVDALRYE